MHRPGAVLTDHGYHDFNSFYILSLYRRNFITRHDIVDTRRGRPHGSGLPKEELSGGNWHDLGGSKSIESCIKMGFWEGHLSWEYPGGEARQLAYGTWKDWVSIRGHRKEYWVYLLFPLRKANGEKGGSVFIGESYDQRNPILS